MPLVSARVDKWISIRLGTQSAVTCRVVRGLAKLGRPFSVYPLQYQALLLVFLADGKRGACGMFKDLSDASVGLG